MRCKSTLAFLLSTDDDAQRRAFDKLIRPVLDKHRAATQTPATAPAAGPAAPTPTPATPPPPLPPQEADPAVSDSIVELDALGAEELAASAPGLVRVSESMIAATEVEPAAPPPRRSRTTSGRLPGVVPHPGDPPEPVVEATEPAAAPAAVAAIAALPSVARRDDDASNRPAVAMFAMPKTSIGLVPKLLASLAVVAMGAVIAVLVWTRCSTPKGDVAVAVAEPPPTSPVSEPTVTPPPPPAVTPPDAAVVDDIEVDPPGARTAPTPPSPPSHTGASTPRVDRGSASAPEPPPAHRDPTTVTAVTTIDAGVEPTPPPAADGCDQVSCVLDQYSRPCCEQFKPKLPVRAADGLPETLDKMQVREGIEPMKPVVITCGEKAAVKGMVKIALEVAPDGSVTSATVSESPDAGLGNCVAGALRKVHFAKTHDGASFVYPFVF